MLTLTLFGYRQGDSSLSSMLAMRTRSITFARFSAMRLTRIQTKLFVTSEVPVFQVFSDEPDRNKPISDHMRSVMDSLVSCLTCVSITAHHLLHRVCQARMLVPAPCSPVRKKCLRLRELARALYRWGVRNGHRLQGNSDLCMMYHGFNLRITCILLLAARISIHT